MASSKVHISIIVYKGTPYDYQRYRHTALCFQCIGWPTVLTHIVGPFGKFEFEHKEISSPSRSAKFASRIEVGDIIGPATILHIVEALQGVPVNNDDPEFNCQLWTDSALLCLKALHYISDDMYNRGLDGMVDAIIEAEDE